MRAKWSMLFGPEGSIILWPKGSILFGQRGQKESAHLIYHTIAPLKVLVMGVNFILPF